MSNEVVAKLRELQLHGMAQTWPEIMARVPSFHRRPALTQRAGSILPMLISQVCRTR